ncbi:MAG: penicillin-insensitive murein endopeptidase [Deltaproteobacteria bacterium]|nr:penicillin-insensitive murein endopeptidase [Deltaproteobacteria bacterium]
MSRSQQWLQAIAGRRAAVLAAAIPLVTTCAALEPRPSPAPTTPPLMAAAPAALGPQGPVEPTHAYESDGELRVAEPLMRRGRRESEAGLDPWVMPLGVRRHPRIGSERGGSASVGTVTAGYIAEAVEVTQTGAHHRIMEKVAPRNTRFTTRAMADVLLCAAERVAKEHPGRVLQLGNLSRQAGGPLPWSVSHHNGRDADVAFYALDALGRPADMARLYHFDQSGQSTDAPEPLTFDVAANWTLLRSLVECSGDELQYLFIASWLSWPALHYAAKHKVDKKVIARVAAKVHQPKKAMPHNDHVHVRIGCSAADREQGCVDASRAPQSAWGHPAGVRARLEAIRRTVEGDEAHARADAVYLIGLYRDGEGYAKVAHALQDRSALVRAEAARVLADWDRADAAALLGEALRKETAALAAAQMLLGLGRLRASDALAAAFGDRRTLPAPTGDVTTPDVTVRKVAVQLLTDDPTLPAARAAVALLDDAEAPVRDAARQLLERATAHVTTDLVALNGAGVPQLSPDQPLDPAAEKALWSQFFDRLGADVSLAEVVRDGFARHGVDLGAGRLGPLVQALAMPAPWRDNAARLIERALRHQPGIGKGARATPHKFWPQFLVQRRHLSHGEVQARMAASLYGTQPSESAAESAPNVPAADAD